MRIGTILLLILSLSIGKLQAQPANMVRSKASVSSYKPGGAGAIHCIVQWSLIKNGKNMKILFFAQNDIRNIPMQLTLRGKDIPLKVEKTDDKYYYTVFKPALKDIFFTGASPKGYTWKWQGAAKAPASPVAELNGQKPKTIKYWFTIKVDGASFSTEPSYIDIK